MIKHCFLQYVFLHHLYVFFTFMWKLSTLCHKMPSINICISGSNVCVVEPVRESRHVDIENNKMILHV